MNRPDPNTRELLERLSRQVAVAVGLSAACLVTLMMMLFFPAQAQQISEASIRAQEWISPQFGGVLGVVSAVVIVAVLAALVLSRVSPPAPPEKETPPREGDLS